MRAGADTQPIRSNGVWRWTPLRLIVFFVALAALYAACEAVPQIVLPQLPGVSKDEAALAAALIAGVAVSAGYWILVRLLEKRRASELTSRNPLQRLIAGTLIGAALFACVYAWLAFVNVAHFAGLGTTDGVLIALAISVSSAIAEEIIFRGVVFRLFEESFGTLVALTISAVLFGLLHAANKGATPASTLAIALEAGLLLAASYTATRSLWLPIGIHFGWNFTEGGVFGAAVSGGKIQGLLNVPLAGPPALTGGEFGPEASIPAVAICLAAAAIFLALTVMRGEWRGLTLRLRAPAPAELTGS